MTSPLQEVKTALRDMLGPEVGIGVTDPQVRQPALLAGEAVGVVGLIPQQFFWC